MIRADEGVSREGLTVCRDLLERGLVHAVRYFSSVDSTNTAAKDDLVNGDEGPYPKLYLADSQTAGRGRHGRVWLADEGTLTFSLAIDLAKGGIRGERAGLMSIASGVAVAIAVEQVCAPHMASLKWPNDIYLSGGKLAGVLVEAVASAPDRLIVGIGVNVASAPDRTALPGGAPARSIHQVAPGSGNRYGLLEELVGHLLSVWEQLAREPHSVLAEFRRRCLLTGQMVRYGTQVAEGGPIDGRRSFGRCVGLADDGTLLIESDGRSIGLRSGDVIQIRC